MTNTNAVAEYKKEIKDNIKAQNKRVLKKRAISIMFLLKMDSIVQLNNNEFIHNDKVRKEITTYVVFSKEEYLSNKSKADSLEKKLNKMNEEDKDQKEVDFVKLMNGNVYQRLNCYILIKSQSK